MSLTLFVLRHAETDWSRERRFAGWQDIPLNAAGRRQCEAAARALASRPVTHVYASPLERARTSAETIAKPHRLAVTIEPAFAEMGFGAWEGLTRAEVAACFPEGYRVWREHPDRFQAPGGEALTAVAARVSAGLARLREAHAGDCVVLVTHAVVKRLIVLAGLGLGPERLWAIDAAPAGITELEYRDDDWVTVHRLNTLTHFGDEGER